MIKFQTLGKQYKLNSLKVTSHQVVYHSPDADYFSGSNGVLEIVGAEQVFSKLVWAL